MKEKNLYLDDKLFSLNKFITKFANIDDRVNIIIKNYNSETEIEHGSKKKVAGILSTIKNLLLDFHLNRNTIAELHKKNCHQNFEEVLSKYSKHSK